MPDFRTGAGKGAIGTSFIPQDEGLLFQVSSATMRNGIKKSRSKLLSKIPPGDEGDGYLSQMGKLVRE